MPETVAHLTDPVKGQCRFGDPFPVVAKIGLTAGCLAYPDDKEQLVCAQHLVSCTPLGEVEILEAYAWPALEAVA